MTFTSKKARGNSKMISRPFISGIVGLEDLILGIFKHLSHQRAHCGVILNE